MRRAAKAVKVGPAAPAGTRDTGCGRAAVPCDHTGNRNLWPADLTAGFSVLYSC